MPSNSNETTNDHLERPADYWPIFFIICSVEGALFLIRLMLIPGDPKNQLFLGYSVSRIVMMALILLPTLLMAILALNYRQNTAWWRRFSNDLIYHKVTPALIIIASLTAVISWLVMQYLLLYPEGKYLAFYERLSPLLTWFTLVGFQTAVWLGILKWGINWQNFFSKKRLFIAAGIITTIFIILWAFISLTGIGITPDAVAWGEPGVALLEWQIWISLAAGVISMAVLLTRKQDPGTGEAYNWRRQLLKDLLPAICLWVLTIIIWTNQPIPRSYFILMPGPPNHEIYPYSDAANHDIAAQHVLIGNGFIDGKVIKRPLLSTFFTFLHIIAGQDYQKVIDLQTLVLAFFPVAMYFLGASLHSRPLGLTVALMAMLREINTIHATPYSRVSHSKLLMSDLPSALGVVIFTFLIVIWIQEPRKRRFLPLICGGTLGLLMLIRTQTIIYLFLAAATALIAYRWRWRSWLKGSLLLTLGLVLSVSPWIFRNWQNTGQIVFDQTEQTGIIAQRYTDFPGYAMPPRIQDETEEEYTSRILRESWKFAFANPGIVTRFVTAHFLNNEITTALVVPIRGQFIDLDDALRISRPFWGEWGSNHDLSLSAAFLLMTNLLIMSIGISACYRRWRIAGLTPLFINIVYSLSNAVIRNSGGRYNLPVDWVGYFYYAIGLFEIILLLLMLFGLKNNGLQRLFASTKTTKIPKPGGHLWKGLLIGACFLFIGSSPPIVETLYTPGYRIHDRQAIVNLLLEQESVKISGLNTDTLKAFALHENTIVVYGRALYPLFFEEYTGKAGFGWPSYEERNYPRLGFLVIGPSNHSVVFPQEIPPSYFPNAADVIVVGCHKEDHLEAVLVTIPGDAGTTYLGPDPLNDTCPEQ